MKTISNTFERSLKVKEGTGIRVTHSAIAWSLLALSSSLCTGYAGNLVSLESEHLGGGVFEYRLGCNAEPYVERCGLSSFSLSFPGFDGVVQEPATWQRAPGFPVPPQSEATLEWLRSQTNWESLPYQCVFRVRSEKTAFRLGTAQITNVLHWHDWAQPPCYRDHIQESLTLNCLVPCEPAQSDGSPALYQDAGSEFPAIDIASCSFSPPQSLLLRISARLGLPLCIEASVDLNAWDRTGFCEASGPLSDWLDPAATEPHQFYRVAARRPEFAHPEALASTEWLEQHLYDPAVRIADIRQPQSDAAFRSGHIPGAFMVYPLTDLRDPTQAPLYLVPTPSQFEALMGQWGINNTNTVVVYDTHGGLWCARLWWALHYYGHENVKILHGGLWKWYYEKRPIETSVVPPSPTTFTAQAHPELRATFGEVQAAIGNTNITILDSLSVAHHTGVKSDMSGLPPGHIPSSKNVPAVSILTADYVLPLPPEMLSATLEQAGVSPDKEIITYCGGGYYGAFNMFVLYQLGYENVRLYDGSWIEWVTRGGPIETGP